MKQENLLKILLSTHTTEKAAHASGNSGCLQYVFEVVPCATKSDIKVAVEKLFPVKVKAVNIVRVKGAASTKFGRTSGRQASWKKAYVILHPGNELTVENL